MMFDIWMTLGSVWYGFRFIKNQKRFSFNPEIFLKLK
jgi:hypothetical protein